MDDDDGTASSASSYTTRLDMDISSIPNRADNPVSLDSRFNSAASFLSVYHYPDKNSKLGTTLRRSTRSRRRDSEENTFCSSSY